MVKEKELLPEEECWNVFANLQDILAFNEVLLTELTERVQKSMESPETELSDLFLSRVCPHLFRFRPSDWFCRINLSLFIVLT